MPDSFKDDEQLYLWTMLGDKAPVAFRPEAQSSYTCSCEEKVDVLIAYMNTLDERDKRLSAALKDKLVLDSRSLLLGAGGTALAAGICGGLIMRGLSRR